MVLLGLFFGFYRAVQQLGCGTQKFQVNVDYCYVWLRVKGTLLGAGLNHPSLGRLTLELYL